MTTLIGTGLYTPAEAGKLLSLPRTKITRWLAGHRVKERQYQPLWQPEVALGDGRLYLGFRDLMELRVADGFMKTGMSPQSIRAAIILAQELLGRDHPLSTDRFRTDGREIFLRIIEKSALAQKAAA